MGSDKSIIEVNLKNEKDKYLSGHIIDGRVLFHSTGYLVCLNLLINSKIYVFNINNIIHVL